ncbi:acetyl-CoA carboxylase biotin carboxyl carrier protein [Clostridium sp. AM58-1XD]|uniref:acetyl-CoA carboxylase biotin carboxyl carrier protein n=1 Tax=Clostridium sp. AM58-1XD TaxID=2292307 RepID=UPI000E49C0F5|nr:acetyl-CoA carboxylase biotin carboxyl carrier protein [Clostridium sp. AM58-1XD]RGZ01160.1 acetyl-CoA carboxylase biotin carboxyl carrier protein [Clostridium sp. AM58-1XD]
MEVKDILKLMQAVSENDLTSFELEDGDTKLSIKKKKEAPQMVDVKFDNSVPAMAAAMQAQAAGAMMAANAAQGIQYTGVQPPVLPAAGAAAPVSTDQASASDEIPSDKVVTSPLVGTFYNASSPDAEPFVKAGDTVKKGQVLGIIEAMKLMNEIESEYDGIVEAVLVDNEAVVEYGQPLFRIR